MAYVELRYGHDPPMRPLDQDIIRVQRREVAERRAWQARHDGPPGR